MENKVYRWLLLSLGILIIIGAGISTYIIVNQQLEARQKEINLANQQTDETNKKFVDFQEMSRQALMAKQSELDAAKEQLDAKVNELEKIQEQLTAKGKELDAIKAQLAAVNKEMEEKDREINRLESLLANQAMRQKGNASSQTLISWWKLDDGADNTDVLDSSGNSYTGTASTNTKSLIIKGQANYAFSLNGSAYIDIPPVSFDNLTAGTITAWVNLDDNMGGAIISKQHNGLNSYVLSVGIYSSDGGGAQPGVAGKLYWHNRNWNTDAVSTGMVTTGSWHHVALVFDSSHATFYIDGAESGTTAGNYSLPSDLSPSFTDIGAWLGDGGGQYLKGKIDDVRIYNRVLSESEIQAIYSGAGSS